MRSLVIIPTYNESENLRPLVEQVLKVADSIDVLVIDDNSPDATGQLAEDMARETSRVDVIHRARKLGLGTAYARGFQYALQHAYDRVVEMDADFSHRPEDLPLLLDAAERADVVIGSRNIPGGRTQGWSRLRQLISRGGSWYARLVLGLPIRDCTSGFKCFRRSALEALDPGALGSNGYAFQVEVNFACKQAGMRISEVPIVFPDRKRGTSKMSSRIVLEAMMLVVKLRLGLRPPALLRNSRPQLWGGARPRVGAASGAHGADR